jgi:hypothetical protein
VLPAPEPFFAPTDGGGFASRVTTPPTPPPAQPVPPPPGGAQAPSTAKREEKARKHASSSAYTIRPAGTSGSEWFLGGTAVATVLTLLLVSAGVRPGPRRQPAVARAGSPAPSRGPGGPGGR